jgi:hypothetical protein
MKLRKLALASLITAGVSIPAITLADSDIGTGNPAAAAADLDFSVIIPEFVYFQIGADATPGATDTVEFDLDNAFTVDGTEVGDGTDVLATDGGVYVALRANQPVQITADALGAAGPLAAGSTEISAANDLNIPVPAFGATSSTIAGPIIDEEDTWTFTYDNAGVYTPGTYSETVTYTAATI